MSEDIRALKTVNHTIFAFAYIPMFETLLVHTVAWSRCLWRGWVTRTLLASGAPMAAIPGAVGRAFACVGPWLASCPCGWDSCKHCWASSPSTTSTHQSLGIPTETVSQWDTPKRLWADVIPHIPTSCHIFKVCKENTKCFPLLVHFSLHPGATWCFYLLVLSPLLPALILQLTLDPNDRLMIKTGCLLKAEKLDLTGKKLSKTLSTWLERVLVSRLSRLKPRSVISCQSIWSGVIYMDKVKNGRF